MVNQTFNEQEIRKSAWERIYTTRGLKVGMGLAALTAGLLLGALALFSPWLALAAVVTVIGVLVILAKPVTAAYVLIPSITFFSGLERGSLIPALRLNEAALAGTFGLVLLTVVLNRTRSVPSNRYGKISFLLIALGMVTIPGLSYLIRGYNFDLPGVVFLLGPLQFFLLFLIFYLVVQDPRDRQKLVIWMLACGAVVAVVGLLQAAGIGAVKSFLASWYPSLQGQQAATAGRVTSLFGAWNALGMFLMTNSLIGWAVFPALTSRLQRVGVGISLALSLACLLATGSFAGILGVVLGIFLLELLAGHIRKILPKILLLAVLFGLVYLAFQPILQPMIDQRMQQQYGTGGGIPQTLGFRFKVWREIFLPIAAQNPVWGVYLTPPGYFDWKFEESQYLVLLLRLGLAGLLFHLAWVGMSIAWLGRQLSKTHTFEQSLVRTILVLFVVLTIAGITNAVFTYSGTADYLWILLALVVRQRADQAAVAVLNP